MKAKQVEARRIGMRAKTLRIRKECWPELDDKLLWNTQSCKGYTPIPRTLPLIMEIIDFLSPKGQPAGKTYFALWCRSWEESLVIADNPIPLVGEVGFSGQRAIATWKLRMQTLKKFGFIDTSLGSAGDYHYILIFNPHRVVASLKGKIPQALYRSLFDRAYDVGAKDFTSSSEEEKAGELPLKKAPVKPKKGNPVAG